MIGDSISFPARQSVYQGGPGQGPQPRGSVRPSVVPVLDFEDRESLRNYKGGSGGNNNPRGTVYRPSVRPSNHVENGGFKFGAKNRSLGGQNNQPGMTSHPILEEREEKQCMCSQILGKLRPESSHVEPSSDRTTARIKQINWAN